MGTGSTSSSILPSWVGETAAARKESVKATYWLDDSKRVVGMKLDASVDGRSAAMDVSTSKFGEPVNIPKVS
mgnify:CR=1 FL=1